MHKVGLIGPEMASQSRSGYKTPTRERGARTHPKKTKRLPLKGSLSLK